MQSFTEFYRNLGDLCCVMCMQYIVGSGGWHISRHYCEGDSLFPQDVFAFQEGAKPLFKERRVFLFERALIITKKRRNGSDRDMYEIKEELMLNEISMAPDMDDLRRNIIIYEMLTGTKFILRAQKTSIRDLWLTQSNDLIQKANTEVANILSRQRSSSVPGEYPSRSPSFAQRSTIRKDREVPKTKSLRRPHSSTGIRITSPSPLEEQVCMHDLVLGTSTSLIPRPLPASFPDYCQPHSQTTASLIPRLLPASFPDLYQPHSQTSIDPFPYYHQLCSHTSSTFCSR